MKKLILITGGRGYLGGRIASKLSENSNFEVSITTHSQKCLLPSWLKNGRIIHLDLTEEEDFTKICQGTDTIIHLAALNEAECFANPKLAYLVNTLGTEKLVRAAEKAKVKRFIYFSTAHVYRSPLTGIITEETTPNPSNAYAKTHKEAEDFVLKCHKNNDTCGIVLRLSNAFGTPVDPNINGWGLAVNSFCKQAIVNKEITLQSSGLEVRDFITIQDIENAVLHFINLPILKCSDGLFNLGGENTMSIINMANFVSQECNKLLNFKPEIITSCPTEQGPKKKLEYRIDKLKSTDFKLTGNIKEEIQNTLNFCDMHFGGRSVLNL